MVGIKHINYVIQHRENCDNHELKYVFVGMAAWDTKLHIYPIKMR